MKTRDSGHEYPAAFLRQLTRAAVALSTLALVGALPCACADDSAVQLGGRRELFVDEYLLFSRRGVELRLHPPLRRDIVMVRDEPWEGSGTDFERLIRDGGVIRMYYMATKLTVAGGTRMGKQPVYACYAESRDGIHWVRPDLGLFDFEGSRHNNIIWAQKDLDNFTPFKDANPACPPQERYKATMGLFRQGLFAFKSADGIHWSHLSDKPVTTKGTFDSQNNAFWDPVRRQYWCYLRGFHEPNGGLSAPTATGIRDIRVSISPDFRTWTEPRLLRFIDSPDEALYTNQVEPYYRAPHLFVGFPTRYVDRPFSSAALRSLPDPVHRQRRSRISPRFGTAITDGQFMSSRDGYEFHRWGETFLPPGPQRDNNWVYGDGYQALGLIETPADDPTAPPELSLYAGEGEWKEGPVLRRYTLRIDGFASLHSAQAGGECLTRPLVFSGRRLSLNFATTVAGSIRVAIEHPDGTPYPGFSAAACDEIFGDTLDRTVTWRDKSELGALAGQPVRIRLQLREADLYSLQFAE